MTVYDQVVQQIDSCILNSLARANCTPMDICKMLDSFLDDYQISLTTVCWRFNELLKSNIICCTLQEQIPYESFFGLLVSNDDLPIFSLSDSLIEKLVEEQKFPVLNSPANQINYVCIDGDSFVLHLHDEALLPLANYMMQPEYNTEDRDSIEDQCIDGETNDQQPDYAEEEIVDNQTTSEISEEEDSSIEIIDSQLQEEFEIEGENMQIEDNTNNSDVVEDDSLNPCATHSDSESIDNAITTDSIDTVNNTIVASDNIGNETDGSYAATDSTVDTVICDSEQDSEIERPVDIVVAEAKQEESAAKIEVLNAKIASKQEPAIEPEPAIEQETASIRQETARHDYDTYSRPMRAQDVAAMADPGNAGMDEKRLSALRMLGLIEPEYEEPAAETEPVQQEEEPIEQPVQPIKESYLFSPVKAPQSELEQYLQQEENEQQFSYKSVLVNVFKDSVPQQVVDETESEMTDKPITNFGEFREEMRKKGFTVKQYVAESTYQYYSQHYININKIKFATSLITYAIALALIVVAYFVGETYADLGFKTYIAVAAGLLVVPGFYCLKYVTYKDKHAPANFSLKLSLVTSFIAALLIMMIFLLLAFFLPSTQANISDVKTLVAPIFYPLSMLLLMPISVLVYAGLYRSKRFHL